MSNTLTDFLQVLEVDGKKIETAIVTDVKKIAAELEPEALIFLQYAKATYEKIKPAITAGLLANIRNDIPLILTASAVGPEAAEAEALSLVATQIPGLAKTTINALGSMLLDTVSNVLPAAPSTTIPSAGA